MYYIDEGYGMTELSPIVTFDLKTGSKHGAAGVLVPNTEAKARFLHLNISLLDHISIL